jgi:nucleoside-diphosphate-sugar epimerase
MDLSRSTVAVTGATGFIGRYLVRALLQRGARVIGVVRDPQRVPALSHDGVELRQADLADEPSLARAFGGADAVVANAALVSVGRRSRRSLMATNLQGTQNVFSAMGRAGVGRAVMTSSASVYRPKRGHFYHERDPLRTEADGSSRLTHYALSKACAEREAWHLADRLGIVLSTARPHTVFGAFDRGTFTRWLKRFMAPPISVFPTRLRLPSVYAGDLAEAFCRMLERDASRGRAYNIVGDAGDHSYWDLMRAYARAGGKVPRLVIPIPVPLTHRYATERARQELDFAGRPPEEAFRETLELERRSTYTPVA